MSLKTGLKTIIKVYMRCYCCNKELSDYEATRRSVNTGDFIDMCNKCYFSVSEDILTLDRSDLRHEEDEEHPDEVFQDMKLEGKPLDLDN